MYSIESECIVDRQHGKIALQDADCKGSYGLVMIPGSGVRGSPRGGGCGVRGGRGVAGRARAVRGAGPALAGPTPPRLALRGHSASERRAASTPCATTLPHAARETTPAHATAPVMLPNSAVMCRRSVPERVLYLFPKR